MIRRVVRAQTESAASWLLRSERIAHDVLAVAAAVIVSATLCSQASAQPFSQALVFGDSSVDSGFYKILGSAGGSDKFNIAFTAAIAAGGSGAPTNSPGLMNSQVLAAYFGLRTDPANQPGGTNFATSGAKNFVVNTGGPGGKGGVFAANSPSQQGDKYLAPLGGPPKGNRPLFSYFRRTARPF